MKALLNMKEDSWKAEESVLMDLPFEKDWM